MKTRDAAVRLKRFNATEMARKVTDLEHMIREFEQMAMDLDRQISAEEDRTGVKDIAHFAYSTFAKAAIQRRDNLLRSAGDMRDQLEAAQDALAEAVEDMKKVELLDQREHTREAAEDAKVEQAQYDEIGRLRYKR